MTLFDKAFIYLGQNEWNKSSNLTNNPSDRGKLTKFGIAQKYHPEIDVANLTEEKAKAFYYKEYWVPSRAESILSERLAIKYFDACVNCGPGTAGQILQKSLNFFSPFTLEVDGQIGSKSLQEINSFISKDKSNETLLITSFIAYLARIYQDLITKDSTQATFARGWIARTFRLPPNN